MSHPQIARAKEILSRIFGVRVRNVLKVIWVLLVLAFVVRYSISHRQELADTVSSFNGFVLIATVVTTMMGKAVIAVHSQLITRVNGKRFFFRESFWMYSASDLVKYVPGGLWNAVARVRLYTTRGMASTSATKAFALEKYWMLMGALGTGALALTDDLFDRIGIHLGAASLWCARVLIFVVWVAVMWAGGRISGRHIHPKDLLRALAEQIVMAVFFGLGVAIPLSAVHANIPTLTAIGAFSLGRGLGYVAVFAPAGIGVREVVTLWAVNGNHGAASSVLVIAMAMNRVMTLVADLASFGLSLVLRPSRIEEEIEATIV